MSAMRHLRARGFVCAWPAALLAMACAAPARGQTYDPNGTSEFALSLGYANISLGSSSVIDSEGAFRFEPSLTFVPFRDLPQLRVGGDCGVTMVLDNSQRAIISNGGQVIFAGSSDIPLWVLEPELRISWRQSFGEDKSFFIEPGVAGGVAFGFLELDADDGSGKSYDADSSTAFGRVFLRAGGRYENGMIGVEASYLAGGNLNFGGNASGDLSEFYVGFFASLSF